MSKTAEEIADDWYCKEYNFEEVRNTPDGQRILERKRKRFIAGYNAASLRSKELQERVERYEVALNEIRLIHPDGNPIKAITIAASALYGEATKEKEESDAVYTVLKSFTEKMWLRLFQPERDELQIILDDVKELENKISSDWYVKIINKESLEAYNRECKRVDELTEELAKIRGSLIISNNSAKRRGEKIAELEGLLNNISAEIHDKPGLYHAWTLINKALGK